LKWHPQLITNTILEDIEQIVITRMDSLLYIQGLEVLVPEIVGAIIEVIGIVQSRRRPRIVITSFTVSKILGPE